MQVKLSLRGLPYLEHITYPDKQEQPILMTSSSVENHLWVGDFHLDRANVKELISHLSRWVDTGSLEH